MHLNQYGLVGMRKGDRAAMYSNGKFDRVAARADRRWAVILAGGDGLRLRKLTQFISGDDRPKQFCRILGELTLLEEAGLRTERSVSPDRILYTVTRTHQTYYARELADRASQRIVQPCSRGTGPAIVCSLLRIFQMDRDATVAILPCDHSYSNEKAFTRALELAFGIAEGRPEAVVLLGVHPRGPEVEYGWIEVGENLGGPLGDASRVVGFHEKPTLPMAELLFQTGCLWNTFVMVGRASAFLNMTAEAVPGLLKALRSIHRLPAANVETRIADWVYDQIDTVDFARQVLTPAAAQLMAVRLRDEGWNDLGDPARVMAVLAERNELPIWAVRWQAERRTGNAASRAIA